VSSQDAKRRRTAGLTGNTTRPSNARFKRFRATSVLMSTMRHPSSNRGDEIVGDEPPLQTQPKPPLSQPVLACRSIRHLDNNHACYRSNGGAFCSGVQPYDVMCIAAPPRLSRWNSPVPFRNNVLTGPRDPKRPPSYAETAERLDADGDAAVCG
jgi:hypothetical protein